MSQDYPTIPGGQALSASLTDIEDRDDSIVTKFSGATEPSTTFAYMSWADTTSGLLKFRNGADNAWIEIGPLAEIALGMVRKDGSVAMTGALDLGSNKAENMATCTAGTDGANKTYVDGKIGNYGRKRITAHPSGSSSNVIQFTGIKDTTGGDITYSAGVYTVVNAITLDVLLKMTNNPNASTFATINMQIDTGSGYVTQLQDDANNSSAFDNLIISYEYTFSAGDKFRFTESGGITTSSGIPYTGFLKLYQSE